MEVSRTYVALYGGTATVTCSVKVP